jgi:uncharacterized protein
LHRTPKFPSHLNGFITTHAAPDFCLVAVFSAIAICFQEESEMKLKLRRFFTFFVLLGLLLPSPVFAAGQAYIADPAAPIFINEIHYDNDGTDAGEAVEIAGPAGTDLTGWNLVLYNGNNGALYTTTTLSGVIPDQQNGYGTVNFSYPENGLQNGSPDGLALVDPSTTVVMFLSYEGTFAAIDGPAVGLTSTDIGVSEGGSTAIGDSLQLTGTGTTYGDFTWATAQPATIDAVNTGQTFPAPVNEPVTIDCGSTLILDEGIGGSTPITATDADGTVIDIAISAVNPAAPITLSDLVPAGAVGETASALVDVDAATPIGIYTVSLVAANNDGTPQTATCDLTVEVQAVVVNEPVLIDCGAPLTPYIGDGASTTITASDADGIVVDIAITTVNPAAPITLSDLVPAGAVGETASALVTVDASTPIGSYVVSLTASNNDGTAQTATCDLAVEVLEIPPLPDVYINEIHYDNDGADAGEMVEVAGPADTDLTDWSLVLYNGNGGTSYNTIPLSGILPDQEAGIGTLAFAATGLQNGSPDGLALIAPDATTVVEFLSYEGIIVATDGPANGLTSTDIGVSEPGDTPVGESLQIIEGVWTGPIPNTFGAINALPTPVLPDVYINELHYDNAGSDTGEMVEVAGPAGTDLTDWTIVLYNGNGGGTYNTIALSGILPDQEAGIGTLAFEAGGLQNGGPDGLALVAPDGTLIEFLSYEGSFTGVGGPADGVISTDIGVSEPNDTPIGQSLQLIAGTWVGPIPNTFGAINAMPVPLLVINEIDYDQPGTDTAEYLEIRNNDSTAANLLGWTVELVNGNGGAVYQTIELPDVSLASGDYYVICTNAATVPNCDLEAISSIQNGAPDAVALSYDGALIDAVSYEGDTAAPYTEGSGDGLVDGGDQGISRCPDGVDTDQNNIDFILADITPGMENICEPPPPPEVCGDPFTPIYEVQGSGFVSPLIVPDVTVIVTVEGIVTSDFQLDSQLRGFHLQDVSGDGNPATSDGIFIYLPASSTDVNVGDHLRLRGEVKEYYDLTEISNVSMIMTCSTGNAITPTPVTLPVSDPSDFEAYEGMLITFPQPLFIAEYFNFDRYGEIVLATSRQFNPTALYDPGTPDVSQMSLENELSRIKLDDARTSQNPDPALHPNGGIFDLTNLFRGGDQLNNVTGVIDYSFGEYKLQLPSGADYLAANPRPPAPEETGGTLKVASFNVLNYFTTLDSRGADTPEEFERQRTKIIAAISQIDADVVGLIEIENNTEAIINLVEGLNDLMGAGTYAYVDTGLIGTDAIKVAFIYKPATISLMGSYAILDSTVDPRFIDAKNRPALAQTFYENATGGVFTAVVNHLKSKGSDCDDLGDPDLGDGAGNCNLTRKAAAEALVDWLATDPTGSGNADFLIIGDLNAYDKEDPIDAIKMGSDDLSGTADDYTDLLYQFIGEYAYSYVFDGQLGYLDHGLASAGILPDVSGVTVWHINADEPDLIDYDMSYKQDAQDALYEPNAFRSSDHDPVIIGLNVCEEVAPTLEVTVFPDTLWPANHMYKTVHAFVSAQDNFDPNPDISLVSVTSNEPDNGPGDGNTINDIVIVDDYTFKLRAERSAQGSGRIYTITYQVTDTCGNVSTQSATVTVPKKKWPFPTPWPWPNLKRMDR